MECSILAGPPSQALVAWLLVPLLGGWFLEWLPAVLQPRPLSPGCPFLNHWLSHAFLGWGPILEAGLPLASSGGAAAALVQTLDPNGPVEASASPETEWGLGNAAQNCGEFAPLGKLWWMKDRGNVLTFSPPVDCFTWPLRRGPMRTTASLSLWGSNPFRMGNKPPCGSFLPLIHFPFPLTPWNYNLTEALGVSSD